MSDSEENIHVDIGAEKVNSNRPILTTAPLASCQVEVTAFGRIIASHPHLPSREIREICEKLVSGGNDQTTENGGHRAFAETVQSM